MLTSAFQQITDGGPNNHTKPHGNGLYDDHDLATGISADVYSGSAVGVGLCNVWKSHPCVPHVARPRNKQLQLDWLSLLRACSGTKLGHPLCAIS